MILHCKHCGKELSFNNINIKSLNIDGSKIKGICRECGVEIEKELQDKYFVEEYKDNKIYCMDNKYVPYWGCHYYFTSIRDCKARIDNCTSAVISTESFMLLNNLMR